MLSLGLTNSPNNLMQRLSLLLPLPRVLTSGLHTSSLPAAPMDLASLTQRLKQLAPLRAAEAWDNVGLLVEPSNPPHIHSLLLTNDLTETVLQEAVTHPKGKPGLIVSYHPPLFKPLKQLTQVSANQRVVVRAIEEGIAVFSPHTSLDNMEGGINDWLLSGLGEGEVRALGVHKHPSHFSSLLELSWQEEEEEAGSSLQRELSQLGAVCSGLGQFKLSPSTLTVECSDKGLTSFLPLVKQKFPSVVISLSSNPKFTPTPSGGKLLSLTTPIPLSEAVKRVKAHLKLEHVRLAHPHCSLDDPLVTTVATCAGSGGSVLEGVKADLLLTGEMSHHQVLAAVGKGSAVILCEHSNTERGFLQGRYRQWLEDAVGDKVQVCVASTDRDPLEIV